MTTIIDGSQHIQIKDSPKLSGVWFSFQVPVFKAAIFWFLVMAVIQDGQQHDRSKMAPKGVHHLN